MIIMLIMITHMIMGLFSFKTYAVESNKIINSLSIENKKDEYYADEIINIKGEWNILDDNLNKIYNAGDTFSMTIPEGLIPEFTTVSLGDMAIGEIIDNKIQFKFTKNIEGLVDRHGGFNLRFSIDKPKEEGKIKINLNSKDDSNNVLLEDLITVNNQIYDGVDISDEIFGKGKMKQTTEGLRWYIRVNQSRSISGYKVKVDDRVGKNHILVPNSIEIKEINLENSEKDVTNTTNIVYDSDNKGFQIHNLDIEKGKFYTIYYNTKYTGNEIDGVIHLENTAKLFTENNGVLLPDHANENGVVIEDLDLGASGWGIGSNYLKFKFKKIDSVTNKPLSNAEFKLSNKTDKYFEPIIFKTDMNGEYIHKDYITTGLYILEELEAPEGYKKNDPKEIRIVYDLENNKGTEQVFQIESKNDLKPINIDGIKVWKDKDGDEIVSQKDVTIALYANEIKIRQLVLKKGEKEYSFNNLAKLDLEGNEINYNISELEIEGYESKISGSQEEGFIVTNTKIEEAKPEKTEVSVKKVWKGKKLDKVTINLLSEGDKIDSVVLSEENNWKYKFSDLEKLDLEGNKINYNISEAEIEGYESKISGSQEEGFIVINREIKNINEVGKSKSDIEAKKSYEDIKSNDIKLQTIEDFKLPKTGINEFLERILYIIGLLLLFTGLFFNKISKNKY